MSRRKEVTVSKPIGTILPDTEEEAANLETGKAAPEESAAEQAPEPEPKAETEPKKPAGAAAVVYLGPDIYRVANHGTVYANGIIPAHFEEKIAEVPAIRGLIVPVDQYAEVAKAVTEPTGRYSFLYNIVLNATKE